MNPDSNEELPKHADLSSLKDLELQNARFELAAKIEQAVLTTIKDFPTADGTTLFLALDDVMLAIIDDYFGRDAACAYHESMSQLMGGVMMYSTKDFARLPERRKEKPASTKGEA